MKEEVKADMQATVTNQTGRDMLGSYADSMIAFMATVMGVLEFEAELAVSQLWDRWISAYADRYPLSGPDDAERDLTAAMEFLKNSEPGDSPGPVADRGWHLMMEHDTRCLAALYDAMYGHYRHHVPNDVIGIEKNGKCNDTNDGGSTSKCVCS